MANDSSGITSSGPRIHIRRVPEDFQVEELTDFPSDRDKNSGRGKFSLYRLTKTSIGTLEAIDSVARRWNLSRKAMHWGGLKDRHAVTRQYLTIERGPQEDMHQDNIQLEYLGSAARPFSAGDIRGNAFSITLRNLTAEQSQRAFEAIPEVRREGFPNYFDDQRFGSLGKSGEFIAKPWCLGNYERALWLAIAEENVHDRPDDRQQKEVLRNLWNDWILCKQALARSSRRSIVTYLCDHPTDYRRALALVSQDLRSLYLAAFQSDLWNRIVGKHVRTNVASKVSELRIGPSLLPFYRSRPDLPADQWEQLKMPLPSARLKLPEGALRDLYESVLAEIGMSLREVRVKYPRDAFFSKGDRALVAFAHGLRGQVTDDELYRGRTKLTLNFELGRGTYATMLLKQIGLDAQPFADEESDSGE